MSIVDGVPKGKPKVIPDNYPHSLLMCYDTFFAEIKITRITPKSTHPNQFIFNFDVPNQHNPRKQ